jgi:hypothetical protein
MAVPSTVNTTFPATISATGESSGVLIALDRVSSTDQIFITASGTYATTSLVIEARLRDMVDFVPIAVIDTSTSALAGTSRTIALTANTTYQWSFGAGPYDQICVYAASGLASGEISIGYGTGPIGPLPPLVTASSSTVTSTGALTSASPTAGVGYSTGAGGAVTQSTNKSTTVVSNTITTAITLNNAQLDAATIVAFTFTNSAIAATDTIICTHQSAGTSGAYTINAFPGAGSAVVSVRNNSAGNLSEAIVVRVTVIKSVSA